MSGFATKYDNVHYDANYQHPVAPHRQETHYYQAPFVNPVPVNHAQAFAIPAMLPRSSPQDETKQIFEEQLEEFWRLMEQRVDESMWNKKRFMRLWNDVCAKTNDELNPELSYRGVVKKERKTYRTFEKSPKLRTNIKVEMKPPVPPRRDSMI